ncbi:biotin transporter BioY [Natronomonas marina]|jgi:biotin transport system substrate-specific component|uniref:biotin transporter BioY n=1 Tax=Natronomonas marina TaxID=2961939 RepID=UPI0020C9BF72|nr:biotin transporter BioY [Natronomonas marina]
MADATTSEVDLVGDETTLNIARAALFAALTGAFAFVSFPIPVTSINVTLQVLGVFLAGILLGPVWGGGAMVLYLAAGAVGAPVFEGGSAGLANLLGGDPSFGYLWSYPPAAALVGYVVHGTSELREPSAVPVSRLVAAMTAGTVVIYALGTLGIMYVQAIGPVAAILAGVVPFVPAEIIKMVAAILVVQTDAIRAG